MSDVGILSFPIVLYIEKQTNCRPINLKRQIGEIWIMICNRKVNRYNKRKILFFFFCFIRIFRRVFVDFSVLFIIRISLSVENELGKQICITSSGCFNSVVVGVL